MFKRTSQTQYFTPSRSECLFGITSFWDSLYSKWSSFFASDWFISIFHGTCFLYKRSHLVYDRFSFQAPPLVWPFVLVLGSSILIYLVRGTFGSMRLLWCINAWSLYLTRGPGHSFLWFQQKQVKKTAIFLISSLSPGRSHPNVRYSRGRLYSRALAWPIILLLGSILWSSDGGSQRRVMKETPDLKVDIEVVKQEWLENQSYLLDAHLSVRPSCMF